MKMMPLKRMKKCIYLWNDVGGCIEMMPLKRMKKTTYIALENDK